MLRGLWLVVAAATATASLEDTTLGLTEWLLEHNPCNIDRFENLTTDFFRQQHKGRRPVVFRRGGEEAFRGETTRQALLERYGDVEVTLASSNSYSKAKRSATLAEYIQDLMKPQLFSSLANETWYLFGDTRGPAWEQLQARYQPPLDAATDDPAVAFGLAGARSGVSFHTHGPAWGETIHGAKRWFLTPPGTPPPFHEDESQLRWLSRFVTPRIWTRCGAAQDLQGCLEAMDWDAARLPDVLECTVFPGEVIYIPDGWWHATLNLDPQWNVFVSVFTHEFDH
jgi:hypothetical protein